MCGARKNLTVAKDTGDKGVAGDDGKEYEAVLEFLGARVA
jgi:hypothetical protein